VATEDWVRVSDKNFLPNTSPNRGAGDEPAYEVRNRNETSASSKHFF